MTDPDIFRPTRQIFHHARRLTRRHGEGVRGLLGRQPQQLGRRRGGPKDAARRGDMPAPRVVLRRDRIADAVRDFHAEQKGEQHLRTGGAMTFSQGEDGLGIGRHTGNRLVPSAPTACPMA